MTNETERGDQVCNEADGCPTEIAVLKREWRRLTEENKRLRDQLAAVQAEITRLGGVCSDYRKTQETMFGDLAASQAREQQLREALKALQQGFPQTHQINAVIRHALVTPQDDTALRQWGANLLEEMAMEIDLGTQETEDAAITLCRKAAELREGK